MLCGKCLDHYHGTVYTETVDVVQCASFCIMMTSMLHLK